MPCQSRHTLQANETCQRAKLIYYLIHMSMTTDRETDNPQCARPHYIRICHATQYNVQCMINQYGYSYGHGRSVVNVLAMRANGRAYGERTIYGTPNYTINVVNNGIPID